MTYDEYKCFGMCNLLTICVSYQFLVEMRLYKKYGKKEESNPRAFFRPKTVKNHIPQFNFRHNTCICPKNIVSLHAVCVQKETTQQPN